MSVLLDSGEGYGRRNTHVKQLRSMGHTVAARQILGPFAPYKAGGHLRGTCLTYPTGLLEETRNAKCSKEQKKTSKGLHV